MKELDLQTFKQNSNGVVLACDEVGRGPLAGDVVSACVYVDVEKFDLRFLDALGIDDSKKLSAKKRAAIIEKLEISWNFKRTTYNVYSNKTQGLEIIVSKVSPKIIDKINILQASLKSMANCVNAFQFNNKKVHLLIDGNQLLKERVSSHINQQAVIKGDSHSSLIGLASIVAKEFRDAIMARYDELYPEFQFRKNSGYPTKAHKLVIKEYGIVPIHRKSFKGVKEFCQQRVDTNKD